MMAEASDVARSACLLGGDSPVWVEQKVAAEDGLAGDSLGSSVAISGDTAIVGAPYVGVGDHASQGAAYIFTRADGRWQEVTRLVASDGLAQGQDRKSTRLNSSHVAISYAVFCLK